MEFGEPQKIFHKDRRDVAAPDETSDRERWVTKLKGILRALYRTLELPGANPLKDAHAALDAAVLAAYGFSAKADLLAQILALNESVAAAIANGDPVTAPGVPEGFADAERLVTEDCIQAVNLGRGPESG